MPDGLAPRCPGGVSLENVSRRFGKTAIFRDVSARVEPGEVLGITGRNGSGKTSLLRLVAGSLTPDSGKIEVGGEPPGRGLAAYIPAGDRALHWRLTGFQNLVFFARIAGVPKNELSGRIHAAAYSTGALELLTKQVGTCSTGQRRRLMVARGLVMASPVLLIDEPFADLDQDGIAEVSAAIRRWTTDGGAVLFASPASEHGPHSDLLLRLHDGDRWEIERASVVRW